METLKTKKIATTHSGDTVRLMRAMGIKDDRVIAFALSASGPSALITVTVKRYLNEAELAALADELEANPLKLEPEAKTEDRSVNVRLVQ